MPHAGGALLLTFPMQQGVFLSHSLPPPIVGLLTDPNQQDGNQETGRGMQDADKLRRISVKDISPLTRPVKCFRSNIDSPQEGVNTGSSE